MLRLRDFFHLPEVDTLVKQLVKKESGLIIVAGPDPRPGANEKTFLPSGRSTIFRALVTEMLDAHPTMRSVVIEDGSESAVGRPSTRSQWRVPRGLRERMSTVSASASTTAAELIEQSINRRLGLLVLDRLDSENLAAVLTAAKQHPKLRIVTQLDTVYHGCGVIQHLLDLGAELEQLEVLSWVMTIQRLPALCPHCRQPAQVSQRQLEQLNALAQKFKALDLPELISNEPVMAGEGGSYFESQGCTICHDSGRLRDVAVFDILHTRPPNLQSPISNLQLLDLPSRLPMEAYIWYLAQRGQLALSDVLHFEADQFRRTFNLLIASEHSLAESNATLERKLAELEAANRVLQQRTRELVTFEDIGRALITSTDLHQLADRVSRRAGELCDADLVMLYYHRSSGPVEILAALGWDREVLERQLTADELPAYTQTREAQLFAGRPPGIIPKLDTPSPRAGLAIPLLTQERQVGLMIVQSTRKARFKPGEAALLETLAAQAAVAIQRAGLIRQLQAKIEELEAAQIGLAQKERLERELELARQLQQSMLPRTFPRVRGYRFAAQNAPARQVGGDFYDVIELNDDYLGIVIADVSDKGMAAALYMTLSRSLLRAEARRVHSPYEALVNLNHLLVELGEQGMFVTVFYGIIDRKERRLCYARAGHDCPFLLRDGRAELLGGRGMALGLFDDEDFHLTEEWLSLAPGDRLVLYTDGLTDATNPQGELFDRHRLQSLLEDLTSLPPNDFCAAAFERLAAFQGSAAQFDDMAMVVVEVE